MPICKVCGAQCGSNERYCSFCGAELPVVKPVNGALQSSDFNKPSNNFNNPSSSNDESLIFSKNDWADIWKRKERCVKGIIFTDTSKLTSPYPFFEAIKKFIAFKAKSGVKYYLLDINSEVVVGSRVNSLENNVKLLKTIYSVSIPKYLMIIGDWSVIPPAMWENETDDDDPKVPSDFVYMTLDTSSPWDGKKYNISKSTRVGRIPASVEHSFEEAISYLNHEMDFKPADIIKGFAYSAYVWLQTSCNVFKNIATDLNISPKFVCRPQANYPNGTILSKLKGYNVLGINLHGSLREHFWYGQYERLFPEAFMASLLPSEKDEGYLVCVEACYGARPTINDANKDSILVNAMKNNCMGFVGSSMIAYGCANGRMTCADIIANVFLSEVAAGRIIGDAFAKALTKLTKDRDDETVIKTLAEFALYGDPSLIFYNTSKIEKVSFEIDEAKNADIYDTGIKKKLIPFNEQVGFYGRRGESYVTVSFNEEANNNIKQVARVVNRVSKEYVSANYKEFSNTEPTMYKVYGYDEYRSVYSKEVEGIKETIRLHLDKNGNVIETYVSK